MPELFEGFGMGAQPLGYDPRDYQLNRYPQIASLLPTVPDSYSLKQYHLGATLNQGSEPSCVAFSSCHMEMLNEAKERRQWVTMDGHGLYHEAGGTGSNGVYGRDVLEILQKKGCPVLGGSARYKIQEYAFVDFSNFDLAVATIKAAIVTERPIVLAFLIPSDMMAGMNAGLGNVVLSGYHQVCGGAYTPDRFVFLNSWGGGYGDGGWGSVPWSYLARSEQRGYLYAYTAVDATDEDAQPQPQPQPDPQPQPQPAPTRRTVVTATATGGGMEFLKQGVALTAQGGGFSGALNVTGVAVYEDKPDPKPQPQPQPTPGELKIVASVRQIAGRPYLLAGCQVEGRWVDATVSAKVGGADQGSRVTKATGGSYVACLWRVTAPPGTAYSLTATDAAGRRGSAAGTV